MASELRLGIGGFVLDLSCGADSCKFESEDRYETFVSHNRSDVELQVHRCATLDGVSGRRVFDSGGAWQLFREQRNWTILLTAAGSSPGPYQAAVLSPDFRSGDIYIKDVRTGGDLLPFPLRYPQAHVLIVNLLARGRGLLLHACGINDRGRGLVFVGDSGAGKSTMADLWKGQEGVTILSDDRIIVREMDGRLWAYGTPWHGDVKLYSPERTHLDSVFVLRHAEENSAVTLGAAQVVSSLLARSFPALWSPEGMTSTLDFLSDLCQEVRCYDLAFLPDPNVIDFIRNVCAR
jgi:hypothetical protein